MFTDFVVELIFNAKYYGFLSLRNIDPIILENTYVLSKGNLLMEVVAIVSNRCELSWKQFIKNSSKSRLLELHLFYREWTEQSHYTQDTDRFWRWLSNPISQQRQTYWRCRMRCTIEVLLRAIHFIRLLTSLVQRFSVSHFLILYFSNKWWERWLGGELHSPSV